MPLEGRFVMPEETVETAVETTEPVEPKAPDADTPPDPDEPSGDAPEEGQQSKDGAFDRKQAEAKIRKANSEAKNLRERLKKLEPLAEELQRIKDAEKSDTERLTDQLQAAEGRIAATRKRLVKTQVQALATTTFADPEDAVGALNLDSYIDSEGDIDEAAIQADLADLLERKPHWAKSQPPEGPRRPAPDRTQASGANTKSRTLTPGDEFAGWLKSQLKP
jgi:hypothetical protein